MDQIYGTFKSRVSEGRGLSVDSVESIGQGRVWTGEEALKIGLVDVIGGLDDAIEIAKNMADLGDEYRIVEYPEMEDPIQKLIKELTNGYETNRRKAWRICPIPTITGESQRNARLSNQNGL